MDQLLDSQLMGDEDMALQPPQPLPVPSSAPVPQSQPMPPSQPMSMSSTMNSGTGSNSNRFAPNRKYAGLALVSITIIFTTIGDIAMALTYDVGFATSDAACAIQSSFGIFLVCTFIQATCFFIQVFGILCKVPSWNKSDFYRVNIMCHFLSSIGFLTALAVFGAKLSTNIKWFFWFELIGTLVCVINLALWFVTQLMRRFIKRRYNQ